MFVDLPPPDPGIELAIASRGMSKGIAQTDGPQVIARPFMQMGIVQVGAQWKNLSSAAASGEAALFISMGPQLGQFQFNMGVAYKIYTGVREPADDKSWEFTGSVTRKFGKAGLRFAAVYSPDDAGGAKRSLFVEGGSTLELGKSTRMLAGIGRRDRVNGSDYTAFNAGIARTLFKGVNVEARFYGTNKSGLGESFEDRLVLSTRLAL